MTREEAENKLKALSYDTLEGIRYDLKVLEVLGLLKFDDKKVDCQGEKVTKLKNNCAWCKKDFNVYDKVSVSNTGSDWYHETCWRAKNMQSEVKPEPSSKSYHRITCNGYTLTLAWDFEGDCNPVIFTKFKECLYEKSEKPNLNLDQVIKYARMATTNTEQFIKELAEFGYEVRPKQNHNY